MIVTSFQDLKFRGKQIFPTFSHFLINNAILYYFLIKPPFSNFFSVVWTGRNYLGAIILFFNSLQSVLDAQWLAYQVQMYYASQGDHREEILKTFNVFPEKFDHMTVVKELNSEIESGVLTGSVKEKE